MSCTLVQIHLLHHLTRFRYVFQRRPRPISTRGVGQVSGCSCTGYELCLQRCFFCEEKEVEHLLNGIIALQPIAIPVWLPSNLIKSKLIVNDE